MDWISRLSWSAQAVPSLLLLAPPPVRLKVRMLRHTCFLIIGGIPNIGFARQSAQWRKRAEAVHRNRSVIAGIHLY